MIPQKGFIVLYGKGSDYKTHVGIVYDVQKLDNGRYRLTTIEGNMSNTVKMYIADYEPVDVYHGQKENPKIRNLYPVPEEERTMTEARNLTYQLRKKDNKYWYITRFLMPWVPGDDNL